MQVAVDHVRDSYLPIAPLRRKSQKEFIARIPGSKSYTNRALILAAQRIGETRIQNALYSDDTDRLAKALSQFDGITVAKTARGYIVHRDALVPVAPADAVDLGGGGTPARFLMSFAASAQGATVITGNSRLCERPMADLIDALRRLGIVIECLGREGHLPVRVTGGRITAKDWDVRGDVSSQFLSSLLLHAAQGKGGEISLSVKGDLVSRPYVAMTVDMMQSCGIPVTEQPDGVFRVMPTRSTVSEIDIETDASAMSYFLSAAALTGSLVVIPGIGKASVQGDLQFVECLQRMGCMGKLDDDTVCVQGMPLTGLTIDMERMPDVVLTLAAVAAQASGPTRITGIGNLRYKECDRIHAAAHALNSLGIEVDEQPAELVIRPTATTTPALIETFDDHRVAMAFAILGLVRPGISIENPACVGKSFTSFWDELQRFRDHLEGTR